MSSATNMHANLIAIDGQGVLITGPSGSGKTLLALHLFRRCHHAKIEVHWIADDQTLLKASDGQLIGFSPTPIKGKIEIRGFGIAQAPPSQLQETAITLNVELGPQAEMVRMWDGQSKSIMGVAINTLTLGDNNIEAAGNAVLAMLGHPVWI